MTVIRPATQQPPGRRAGAPSIVLTYPMAGFGLLASVLAAHPDVACTVGTGILPLCDQAVVTWQRAEGSRAGTTSGLAVTTVRNMTTTLTSCVLARSGKSCWCEICFAAPEAAERFQRIFPGTPIICFHRHWAGVVGELLRAYPSGLTDPAFLPFNAVHPDNTIAAAAAYWVARTKALLSLEKDSRGTCHRLRYEDVVDAPIVVAAEVYQFLGLRPDDLGAGEVMPAGLNQGPGASAERRQATQVLAGKIPPELMAQVGGLLRALAYSSTNN